MDHDQPVSPTDDDIIADGGDDQGTPTPAPDNNGGEPDATPPAPATNDEPEGALIDNDEQPEERTDSAEEGDSPAPAASADQPGEQTPKPETPAPEENPQPVQEKQESIADPGTEFVPKGDYAFDIELADGSKVHIAKPEDIEQLPNDVDFGSPANLMKAQAKLNLMTSGIDQERREWEANKEKFEAQTEQNKETEARVNTMIAEMNYLESKGKLPKVAPELENADWSDPEVQKQPGVKERMELLNYRAKENQERTKLGLSPMSLMEAHSEMQREVEEKKAIEVKNKQAEQRKAKGAMVGGNQPSAPSSVPDDMIVGEGGSIRDLNPAY